MHDRLNDLTGTGEGNGNIDLCRNTPDLGTKIGDVVVAASNSGNRTM
jgi:hypothetical protein